MGTPCGGHTHGAGPRAPLSREGAADGVQPAGAGPARALVRTWSVAWRRGRRAGSGLGLGCHAPCPGDRGWSSLAVLGLRVARGRHKRSASAAPSPAGLRMSPVAASRPPPPAATWAAPSGSARDPEGLGPGRCARGHLCQRDVTMRQCPLWRGPPRPPLLHRATQQIIPRSIQQMFRALIFVER